jgi:hypothetical protein
VRLFQRVCPLERSTKRSVNRCQAQKQGYPQARFDASGRRRLVHPRLDMLFEEPSSIIKSASPDQQPRQVIQEANHYCAKPGGRGSQHAQRNPKDTLGFSSHSTLAQFACTQRERRSFNARLRRESASATLKIDKCT